MSKFFKIFLWHLLGPVLILRNKCRGVYSVKYGNSPLSCLQETRRTVIQFLLTNTTTSMLSPEGSAIFIHRRRFHWFVRHEGRSRKVWIYLCTCCVARAVHLDLVTDLTTPSFLRNFRRFVARRGLPVQMLSENGKMGRWVLQNGKMGEWEDGCCKGPKSTHEDLQCP